MNIVLEEKSKSRLVSGESYSSLEISSMVTGVKQRKSVK